MDFDFTTETITPDSTNILTIGGTGGIEISVGTTAERPVSPIDGTIRYNTTDSKFEFYQNSVWINIGTSPLTTKGDLYTHNATVDARLPVGTSGYFLKANPATATGLEWVQNPALILAQVDEEPTGFPNREDSEILFDEGTRIFTIQPKSPATQFSVYQRGVEFIKTTAETVTLPNTTALYFISYDTAGVLQSSTIKYDLSEQAPVSLVYWNNTTGYATLFGEERHGLTMDWATHSYLHDTRGTQYVSGLTLGDFTIEGTGNDNTDAQMGILGGVIADEDIYLTIVNSLTPTLPFEQILSPLGEFPVLYRLGTGGIWYVDPATVYPLKMGTTYPTWNEDVAGTWATTEVTPNAYIAMFLLATNDVRHPVVAIMGQNESVSLPNALRDNTFYALNLGTIPFLEFRPLYRLIFEVKSNYNNDVKAALRDVTDIRLAPTIQIEQATATGTVTSVGLALPSIFTVSGSPVTASGTLTGTLVTQANNTVFAGPASGGPAIPTFRTVGIDELSDVIITSPITNQVIAYDGTDWINTGAVGANATGTVGVSPSGGGTAWTLISGNRYRADFVHNLGTTNVVVTVWDTNTNAVVIPNTVETLDANTIRISVTGNTRTLKVVVVANGQSIVAGGSTPSSVITAYEGVTVSTAATKLNFRGQAVGVVDAGAGTTDITIGSRFTYFANSLDTPNNSDFALNVLSPVTTDPTYSSLNVRSFSNTTEQGVACTVSIPTGATQITIKIRGRAQTAPGTASVVQPRLYYRLLPNNSAVGAWSAAQELANIAIPTNANFQYATQTILLSALGLAAGNLYQFEFTRRTTGVVGTNLAANFLMAELTLEFA